MNKPAQRATFNFSRPLSVRSPDLQRLFDHIADGAAYRERERILPYEIVDLIRLSRFGSIRIPAADGGGGSLIRELLDAVVRLASADANVAHIFRNHFSVVERFVRTPRDTQSRAWQTAVLDGAVIGLATTELASPQVGDVTPDTTLTPEGDGYRLEGTKYYSTGTLFSDYILVRAATLERARVTLLVPTKREGVELVDDWDGMGQRLTGSGTTHFRNVRAERSEVIFDGPEAGYGIAYSNTFAQLYLTAINAGIIDAVLRDAKAMVLRRGRNFYYAPAERPADDPLVHLTVGQISSNAFAARSIVLAAADALDAESLARDQGAPSAELAARAALLSAQAKIVVDELAIRSAGMLFDAGGASVTGRAFNFDSHWRNARTLSSHNPITHKASAIGNYEINGTPLPAKGFF